MQGDVLSNYESHFINSLTSSKIEVDYLDFSADKFPSS